MMTWRVGGGITIAVFEKTVDLLKPGHLDSDDCDFR